ncbi:hypothetical protein Tco_0280346 [Tanacetum coccineum]
MVNTAIVTTMVENIRILCSVLGQEKFGRIYWCSRSVQDDTSECGSDGEENPSDGIDSRVCMGLEKYCPYIFTTARVLSAASFENNINPTVVT